MTESPLHSEQLGMRSFDVTKEYHGKAGIAIRRVPEKRPEKLGKMEMDRGKRIWYHKTVGRPLGSPFFIALCGHPHPGDPHSLGRGDPEGNRQRKMEGCVYIIQNMGVKPM